MRKNKIQNTKIFRHVVWFLLLVLCSGTIHAQNMINANGVVLDSNDEPLTGVTVSVVGQKNKNAITDVDGKFSIKVKQGAVLQFRYIGCKPSNFQVKNDKPITKHHEDDSKVLDEVVVTAMGISREARSLSYARQSVDTESMTEARGTSLMDMLAGKAAGMQVTGGGGPLASTGIMLRGASSINGNNQPLYVIDGVPVLNNNGEDDDMNLDFGNPVNSINPDEIANIEVLKGANASALYGSDASNGVILITTKTASNQKGLGVTYDFNMMFGKLYNYPEYQNIWGSGQNMGFQKMQGVNYYNNTGNGIMGFNPNLPYNIFVQNMADQNNTCWGLPMLGFQIVGRDNQIKSFSPQPETIDELYQTSTMITNSVQVDKKFEKGSFRFSYSNVHSDDIVKNTNKLNRNNFSLRGTAELAKWLDIDASARYTNEDVDNRGYRNNSNTNPVYVIQTMPRDVSVAELTPWKNPDGTAVSYSGFINPFWLLNENSNADTRNWFVGNLTLNVKLPYGLKLRGRVSTDTQNSDGWNFLNMGQKDISKGDGEYSQWKRKWVNNNMDVLLSYNKRFFRNKLSISANIGASQQEITGSRMNSKVDMLAFPDIKSLSNAASTISSLEDYEHKKKQAVFGMANVGYNNWAYLDLTARNEWSSTLPKDNNSYFYWSAGLGLVVSDLLKLDPHIFPFLKLRGSYAEVGNDTGFDQLLTGYYKDINKNSFAGLNYFVGENVLKTMALKPERTRSYEFGAELRFLDNRISVDATYYNKTSYDQIVRADAPKPSGYGSEVINAGKMRNKGVELTLKLVPVQSRVITWTTTFNWSRNKNVVLELAPNIERFELGNGTNIASYAVVGMPWGVFYGSDYKYNEDGTIPVSSTKATPGDSNIDRDAFLGYVQPDWIGGWSNTIRIKDFDLGFSFDFQKGGKVWSQTAQNGARTGQTVQSLEGRLEWFLSYYAYRENDQERAGFLKRENYNGGASSDYSIYYPDWERPKGIYLPNSVYADGEHAGEISHGWYKPTDYWMNNNGNSAAIYMYDASYIKLRELTVGYNVPTKWVRKTGFLRSAKLSLVGRNVAILYQNTPKGVDPQATSTTKNGRGFEKGFNMPQATYGFDIKVTF